MRILILTLILLLLSFTTVFTETASITTEQGNVIEINKSNDIQIESIRTIALIPFKYTGIDKGIRDAIVENLITSLGQSKRFELIETSNLQAVIEERNWQMTDDFTDEQSVTIGELVSAEVMLTGHIYKEGDEILTEINIIDISAGIISETKIIRSKSLSRLPNRLDEFAHTLRLKEINTIAFVPFSAESLHQGDAMPDLASMLMQGARSLKIVRVLKNESIYKYIDPKRYNSEPANRQEVYKAALLAGANLIYTGNYYMYDDTFVIRANLIDVFNPKKSVDFEFYGPRDENITKLINRANAYIENNYRNVSPDLAVYRSQAVGMIYRDSTKITMENKQVAEILTGELKTHEMVEISAAGEDIMLLVPTDRFTVIFSLYSQGVFQVIHGFSSYNSNYDGYLALSFDNKPGKSFRFTAKNNQGETEVVTVKQEKPGEVKEYRLTLTSSSSHMDNKMTLNKTLAGTLGFGLTSGLSLITACITGGITVYFGVMDWSFSHMYTTYTDDYTMSIPTAVALGLTVGFSVLFIVTLIPAGFFGRYYNEEKRKDGPLTFGIGGGPSGIKLEFLYRFDMSKIGQRGLI